MPGPERTQNKNAIIKKRQKTGKKKRSEINSPCKNMLIHRHRLRRPRRNTLHGCKEGDSDGEWLIQQF